MCDPMRPLMRRPWRNEAGAVIDGVPFIVRASDDGSVLHVSLRLTGCIEIDATEALCEHPAVVEAAQRVAQELDSPGPPRYG